MDSFFLSSKIFVRKPSLLDPKEEKVGGGIVIKPHIGRFSYQELDRHMTLNTHSYTLHTNAYSYM